MDGDKTVDYLLRKTKHRISNWLNDSKKIFKIIDHADIIIIDSYLADRGFYEKISEITGLPLYIDDTMRIDYPRGIVINGGINALQMGYKTKNDIVYLLGPEYAPLRREFWDVPEKEIREDIESVLVTFGGDDMRNMTSNILSLLVENYSELSKNIVIGNGFQNIDEIGRISDKRTNLVYSPCAEEMKRIMLESDIAISGGGQTLYELARIGVPTIAVAVADNQMNNVKGWEEAGFIEYAGWWEDGDLFRNIERSVEGLKGSEIRSYKSQTGRDIIDGKGALLIVDCLLDAERNG